MKLSGMSPVKCKFILMFSLISLSAPASQTAPDPARLLDEGQSILEALEDLEFEMQKVADRIKLLLREKELADLRYRELEVELEKVKKEGTAAKEKFRGVFRVLARLSSTSNLALFLSSGDYEQYVRKKRVLNVVTRKLLSELKELAAGINREAIAEFKTGIERANLYVAAVLVEKRQDELTGLRREKEGILKKIMEEKRFYIKYSNEVAAQYNALIQKISSSLGKKKGTKDFSEMRGKLQLPVAGAAVIQPFGVRIHPKFKTKVTHNGLTIHPKLELNGIKNVRTVAFGKVIYAGELKGFGNTVIVDHAGDHFTLYSGLSKIAVENGKVVQERDIIGKLILSEPGSQPALYFELREWGKPADPAEWLQKQ